MSMAIKLASDLDDYEHVESFYPHMSAKSQQELDAAIKKHRLVDDPTGLFEYVSHGRRFVMVFADSGHERDSSNDRYTLYVSKHRCNGCPVGFDRPCTYSCRDYNRNPLSLTP